MRVLVLYQQIDSGAKVATEALLQCLTRDFPEHEYIIYRQELYRFSGRFSFVRNLLWSILDFRRFINQHDRVDTVYTTVFTSILSLQLSNKRHIPSVFHLHGDHRFGALKHASHPFFFFKSIYARTLGTGIIFLQKHAIAAATKTIFVAEAARDEFVNRYQLQHLQKKFVVIYNGVSSEIFRPISLSKKMLLRSTHAIPLDKSVVTYIGRIDEKKGIHSLIEASSLLSDCLVFIIYPQTKDTHSQRYLSDLRQLARTDRARVQFVKNPKKIFEYYQLSDCVVLPSEQEMMPLVMLESLACGVPFLCTQVGGVKEVMKSLPALLLKSTRPQYLATRIDHILKLPTQRKESLRRAELTLAASYRWEKAANQLEAALQATQY